MTSAVGKKRHCLKLSKVKLEKIAATHLDFVSKKLQLFSSTAALPLRRNANNLELFKI